jgi:hypothetical protein
MARRDPDEDEDEMLENEDGDEGPGLVGRLFRTGAAAPNVAMKILASQVAGWKKDFLGIFQAEIRRFFDRQDAGAELRRLIEGKRLEVSIRLVDDDGRPAPAPKAPKAEKAPAAAKPRKKR